MNKTMIFILLSLLLSCFGVANEIVGNSIIYVSQYATLNVTPHTVVNPFSVPQSFTVTSKGFSGDLCVAYVFNDSLLKGNIKLWKAYDHPYTYCFDDDCISTEIRYTYYEDWLNINNQFDKLVYQGNTIYYHQNPLHFDSYEAHTWQIKYMPKYDNGKWELWTWNSKSGNCKTDYQTANYDFFYNLDPWWESVNVTQGFIYLTNTTPYSDTAESYQYERIQAFDTISGWAGVLTISADSNRMEGKNSINAILPVDGTTNRYSSAYTNEYLDCSGDTVAFWFKYDDLTKATGGNIGRLYLGDGSADRYESPIITTADVLTNDQWYLLEYNKSEFGVTGTPNWSAINWTRIYVYGLANQLAEANYDHLYCYNKSNYFNTSNWEVTSGNWSLAMSDNGFGYNSTWITLHDETNSVKRLNFSDSVNYDNYEIIMKMKRDNDYGTESCYIFTGINSITQSHFDYAYIRKGSTVYLSSDGHSSASLGGLADDTVRIYKFTHNNTMCSWYESDDFGHTWNMTFNDTCTANIPYIQLRGRDNDCYIDNIIVRELIPAYVSSPYTVYPSFIYDDENNTAWDSTTYSLLRTTNITTEVYTTTNNNPSDFDQNVSYTITDWGSYQWNITVCDTLGYCAWNLSINNLFVDMAKLIVFIYNESSISQLLTGITFTIDLLNDGESYYNQSTTSTANINYTNIPTGEFELRYWATDFVLRNYYNSITTGQIKAVNLYALKDTVNYLDVYVQDFGLTGISNATITIQKWDTSIGGGITVAEGITNAQGLKRFYLDKENTYYRFLVSYGGSTIWTSGWEIIIGNTYRITTDIQVLYTLWPDLDGILTFTNSSLPYYFTLVYNNKDTDIYSVYLDVKRNDMDKTYDYNITGLTTDSGTITITINENQSYTAYAYYYLINGNLVILDSLQYTHLSDMQEDFKQWGLFLALIITIVLVFGTLYVTKQLIPAIAMADVSLLAIWIMRLYPFNPWSLGIIIPGSVVVMYYLNKQV